MEPVPFVDLAAQYRSIGNEVDAAIKRVLSRCNFILGAELEEFENEFAGFVGAMHGVGVSNGLEALRLSLQALGIREGDEIVIPANTFIATALAVSAVGATPVLVDCDPGTYNIDPERIEAALTRRTRAIIPVHLTGQAADMDPILDIGKRKQLHIIEDAAQAHGTLYKGRPCGSLGITACFSFYPGKNLGAYGDGGLIATNDSELATKLRRIRNYGQDTKYHHHERGVNSRLDTLQAAVLSVKLKYLKTWNEARAKHAQQYHQMLEGVGDLTFQQRPNFSTHVYHLFIIETERRDQLQKYLMAAGIQTIIHYPITIHLQKAYADLGHKEGDFPESERAAKRMLSLPMYAELSEAQIEAVSGSIRAFFASE
ncbi:dTDP-4-amino-4,6-dideoxygalactose transaminase [Rhizobiales bacterium GAS113]|nr:dTDP-4-amino-4,6-dideoxygalactose transaminase [Rhizobiales bacterium GAS113]